MGPSLLLLFDFDSGRVPRQYKWWSEGLRTISSVSKTHRLNQRKSGKQIHNARRVSSDSVPGQSSLMKTPKSSFLKKTPQKNTWQLTDKLGSALRLTMGLCYTLSLYAGPQPGHQHKTVDTHGIKFPLPHSRIHHYFLRRTVLTAQPCWDSTHLRSGLLS